MRRWKSSPRSRSRWVGLFTLACLIGVVVASQVDAASATGQKAPSAAKAQKKSEAYKPPPQGHWREAASMAAARISHTATRLLNGTVLVVGGVRPESPLSHTAEIFDPAAHGGRGAWLNAGSLHEERGDHTATLLPDGTVLVIGGWNYKEESGEVLGLASVERYDPAGNGGKGAWITMAPLQDARYGHTATLLPTGKVLIMAGAWGGMYNDPGLIPTVELYDPAANQGQGASQIIGTLNPTNDSTAGLYWPTATLLPNGSVLLLGNDRVFWGGVNCTHQPRLVTVSADERTVEIQLVSEMVNLCTVTATLLSNGQVLLVGYAGYHRSEDEDRREPMALLYDDAPRVAEQEGRWTKTDLPRAVGIDRRHCATLLPNGTVLVTGARTTWADVYDPAAPRGRKLWTATGNMRSARGGHTATLLTNGTVLVVGGEGERGPLASAEIYEPIKK